MLAGLVLASIDSPAQASSARRALQSGALSPPISPGRTTRTISNGRRLVFNANFQGKAPNPRVWRPTWFGRGSGVSGPVNPIESACFDSSNVKPGKVGVALNLTAVPRTCQGQTRPYTGAILSTDPKDGRAGGGFQYRYGVLQTRVYLPGAKARKVANWPVVMTLGQPGTDVESDILEGLFGAVCAHYHAPGIIGYVGLGRCDRGLRPGWHTFAEDWEPGSVTYFYDGRRVDRVTRDVSSTPQYIVMANTAASASADLSKPAAMTVAYIKVWQRRLQRETRPRWIRTGLR